MSCINLRGIEAQARVCTAIVVIAAVAAITLLVTGILGACNMLAIPPTGGYVMIGVSLLIISFFVSCIKVVYESLSNCKVFNP